MKKLYLLIFFLCFTLSTFSQIKYDDGPIITNNSSNSKFVIAGTWGRSNITYSFQNGTNDIPNNDEQNAVRRAFQLWADYGNLNFTEATNNADLIILWGTGNHGDGFPFDGVGGVLAHAFYPLPNNGTFSGDIHFDDDETWTLLSQTSFGQPIDLETVAAHEIGHALGLNHSSDACALMNPFYTGSHRYLSKDDIEAIQSIYGSRNPIQGPANFCTTATYNIPNLPVGSSVTWAAAGTIAISGSANANPVTVIKAPNSPGVGTLNATINTSCGSTVAVPKSINAGLLPVTPDFSESQVPVTLVGSTLEPTVCIPSGTSKQIKIRIRNVRNLRVTPIYGTSTLSGGSEYITYQFNYSLSVCVIIVDYDTDCGHIRNSIVVRNPCYNPTYTFAVSPNPANSILKISQETNLAHAQSKATIPLAQEIAVSKASFEVKLFDDKGNLVLNDINAPDSKDITLNTQNIPNGFYFLHITEGKETVIKQIIIQH